MNDHLNDGDFAAALAGGALENQVAEHLAACVSCRRQLARLQGLIEQRRGRMERDAPDWGVQWEHIAARLDDAAGPRRPLRWLRLALAAAALIAVAVGLELMQQPKDEDVPPDLAVEEILAETDALLADDSIPGFEVIDPGLEVLENNSDNGVS